MKRVKKIIDINEIFKILKDNNINYRNIGHSLSEGDEKNEFKRNIDFKVYGIEYRITWYVNLCTLYIRNKSRRCACIPFYSMKICRNAPVAFGGNYSLVFYSILYEDEHIYESFRIPLDLSKRKK